MDSINLSRNECQAYAIETNLLGRNPLVLGKTLVLNRLLDGSPDSESSVVLLSLGQTRDGLIVVAIVINRSTCQPYFSYE